MPDKYKKSSTDILKLAATSDGTIIPEICSYFDGFKYFGEDTPYIDRTKLTKSTVGEYFCDFWGTEDITIDAYKYQSTPIPLCASESAPCPTIKADNDYLPFDWELRLTPSGHKEAWFWYDSADGYIKYSYNKDLSSPNKLYKTHGIYIALQGGGGGGGGANGWRGGAEAHYQGASGGGGGGFCLVYINLKLLGRSINVWAGPGGSGGGRGQNGGSGKSSGVSTYAPVYGRWETIASADGGEGGWKAIDSGHGTDGGYGGGAGWGATWQIAQYKGVGIIAKWGKQGGSAAARSGWMVGIPFGHKSASKGGSFTTDEYEASIKIPILNNSATIARDKGDYHYGQGTSPYGNWTSDAYWSEGGGGGGSVCGCTTGGLDAWGYGTGGYGGCAEPNFDRMSGHNGYDGAAFILKTHNL